jgi:hypothetical protein
MLRKLILGVVVLVVVIVVAGVVMPTATHAESSIVIQAPPSAIFPDIASLKAWQQWTKWNTKEDPSWNPVYEGTRDRHRCEEHVDLVVDGRGLADDHSRSAQQSLLRRGRRHPRRQR